MGMNITAEMFGLGAVLAEVDVYVGRQVVLADAAVQAAADICLNEAQARCPVDTGYLRDSLAISRGVMESAVGTDVLYAKFVELGHHSRSGSWVPPQPFLFPAFALAEVAMEEMMKNNLP
jgi:hypothetical protein